MAIRQNKGVERQPSTASPSIWPPSWWPWYRYRAALDLYLSLEYLQHRNSRSRWASSAAGAHPPTYQGVSSATVRQIPVGLRPQVYEDKDAAAGADVAQIIAAQLDFEALGLQLFGTDSHSRRLTRPVDARTDASREVDPAATLAKARAWSAERGGAGSCARTLTPWPAVWHRCRPAQGRTRPRVRRRR